MDQGRKRNTGEPRTALCDLTNRVGKRGLFVTEKNEIPSSDSDDKQVVKRIRVSPAPSTDNDGKILGLEGNVELVDEDKRPSLEKPTSKIEAGARIIGFGEENDPKMSDLVESGNDCEENVRVEGSQSDYHNDVDGYNSNNADNFMLSQSGSFDCTMQSESVKEDDFCMSGKDCSCSFCTKAAYIWFDLNYQDMKARLPVMKKSQEDASVLAERSSRINFPKKYGSGSSTGASKLESHLMYQWRSLFQRTAEIWEMEGNHLEANLLPLTEQREKCKAELESKVSEKLI